MKKHQSLEERVQEKVKERLREMGYGPLGPTLTDHFHQKVITPYSLRQIENQVRQHEEWRNNLHCDSVI